MRKHVNEIAACIFTALFGIILITICSENSFLYAFNVSGDVNGLFTTARSMQGGKVLFKDICGQNGLYLYGIYALANRMDGQGFLGAYVIECIFAAINLCLTYKIARFLTGKINFSLLATVAAGILTYTSVSFQTGGMAEEMALPILTGILYICVKLFAKKDSYEIPLLFAMASGALCGLIFWMKYTMGGMAVGFLVFLIVEGIRRKEIKKLLKILLMFLIGFAVASLPNILYFASNDAMKDMLKAYFCDLPSMYADGVSGDYSFTNAIWFSFANGDYLPIVFIRLAMVVFLPAGLLLGGNRMKFFEKPLFRKNILFMFAFGCIMLFFEMIHENSSQVLTVFPYAILGMVMLYGYLTSPKTETLKLATAIKNGYRKIFPAILLIVGVVCMFGFFRSAAVIALIIAYMSILFFGCGQLNKIKNKKLGYMIKYFSLILVYILANFVFNMTGRETADYRFKGENTNSVCCAALIVFLIEAVIDYYNNKEKVDGFALAYAKRMRKSKLIRYFSPLILAAAGAVMAFVVSDNTELMFMSERDLPQCRIAQYIKEKGKDNPVILYYEADDTGAYNILGTTPEMKYYTDYCTKLPEAKKEQQEYISRTKADYIICTGTQGLSESFEGYKPVLEINDITKLNIFFETFYLYEKK